MREKIAYINSLRGLACLMVLISHIIVVHPVIGSYASGCGKIGVWLFMVLSGYLTLLPYEKDRGREFHLLKYYFNKVVKLYPSYLAVLLFALGIGYFDDVLTVIRHLALLQAVGHFWYIPVIIKMYIFLPLFIFLRKRIESQNLYLIILLVIFTTFSVAFPYQNCPENSTNLVWYLPVFVMGMILANLCEKKLLESLGGIFDIISVLCLIAIVLMTPIFREKLFGIPASSWLQNKYLYIGALWTCLVFATEKGRWMKVFWERVPGLSFIGRISYQIYLIHCVILLTLWNAGVAFGVNVAVTIIGSLVLSYILWLIVSKFEGLIGRLKDRCDRI